MTTNEKRKRLLTRTKSIMAWAKEVQQDSSDLDVSLEMNAVVCHLGSAATRLENHIGGQSLAAHRAANNSEEVRQ